jgi:MarR family transcriptional regulator, lower aerobic nicotinate degradation pathway regulator
MTVTSSERPTRPVPLVAKELLESNGFLLARLGLGFKARALAKLDEAGFEPFGYGVLATVNEGASKTQATIAEALMLDPSRLVALLDTLEDDGLIARKRDPSDRRRHLVTITAEGKRKLAKLRGIIKELEDEFLAPLDAADRRTLHELLLRLAAENDPRCAFVPATPAA